MTSRDIVCFFDPTVIYNPQVSCLSLVEVYRLACNHEHCLALNQR